MIVDEGLVLGDEPDDVPRARRYAAAAVTDAGFGGLATDAELVASELVTNAFLHGARPIVLRVVRRPAAVRIEVEDAGLARPVRALTRPDAMTGRGIALVEALSRGWGVRTAPAGKVVWAELSERADTVAAEAPGLDLDVDALIAAWDDKEAETPRRFTVRLGDVPTGLLLDAKAHVDNLVREFHLAATGAASGHSAALPVHLAELVEAVVHGFADARQSIKRQALASAERGAPRTELTVTLPLSSADAGEAYLTALDEADAYARAARLLTLETPPQHRVFRRWYVGSLIAQLRAASTGATAEPPQTFEQRLLEELDVVSSAQRATERTARLHTVTAALAGTSSVADVAAVVVSEGVSALRASAGGLLTPIGEDSLGLSAAVGYSAEVVQRLEREGRDAALPGAHALRSGEPVWLESRQERDQQFPALAGLEPTAAAMCAVPLVVGDRVLGALRFSFESPRLFDAAERQFVLALAAQTTQALERTVAQAEARLATERLSFLAEASAALLSTLDYRDTLSNIARLVVPELADWCAVELLEDGQINTVAIAHVDESKARYVAELRRKYPPDPAGPHGVPNVLRTGVAELYREIPPERIVVGDDENERQRISRVLGFKSAMIVPLIGRSGTVGVLTMVQAESERQFGDADLVFAEELARRAAVAVENALQFGAQTGRLAAITRVAETVQRAILAPVPERVGPVRLAARYVSAAEDALVGGDLYEVVARPGAVRLLIGDVRGKGLDAVRLATIVLGGFRGAAVECDDLADLARRMDRRIRPYLSDEDFVTALIAEIGDDGTCQIVDCGHPAALLAHDGQITSLGSDDSPPIGLGAAPTPITVRLAPGDRLLLHTDGLNEARDAAGQFVDVDPVVAPLTTGELSGVLDDILERLRCAAGDALNDDVALLVAEYSPE